MPYDVTIITVKPNTHMKALPGIEQWLKANPRKGEFLGCLYLRDRRPQPDPAAASLCAARPILRRPRGCAQATPIRYGCLELTDAPLDRHVRAVSRSCRRSSPASYGPIFEVRTYLLKPTGLPPTIAAWEKQAPVRMKLSPILAAMYSTTGEVTRFLHIWPYPDLATTRAQTRKTAIETGVWPPPGGPDQLLTMHNDIYLPAAFSPMR